MLGFGALGQLALGSTPAATGGVDTTLATSLTASAVTSVALSTAIRNATTLTASATASVALTTAISPATALTASSTLATSLATSIRLSTALTASSTLATALTTSIRLATSQSATATASSVLSTQISLSSGLTSSASLAADLLTQGGFAASLSATSTLSTSLSTAIRAAVSLTSSAVLSNALSTQIALSSPLSATATVSTALLTQVRFAALLNASAILIPDLLVIQSLRTALTSTATLSATFQGTGDTVLGATLPARATIIGFLGEAPPLAGTFQKCVVGWAKSAAGHSRVLWEDQNSPRPSTPFVSLRINSISREYPAHIGSTNDAGISPITSTLEIGVVANFFGTGALLSAESARESLSLLSTLESFERCGIAVIDAETVTNAPKVTGSGYESLASLQVLFRISSEVYDNMSVVNRVRATGALGAYQTSLEI